MSVKSLVADPEFNKLSPQEQQSVLSSIDPDFKNIGVDEVGQVVQGIRGQSPESTLSKLISPQDVGPNIQKAADTLNIPGRAGRGAGVAIGKTAEATGLNPLNMAGIGTPSGQQVLQMIQAAKNPGETLGKVGNAIKSGLKAFQPAAQLPPDQQAYGNIGQTGADIASMAAMGGASAGLPLAARIGADTAISGGMSALSQAQQGKVKVLPSGIGIPDSIVGNALIPAAANGIPAAISNAVRGTASKILPGIARSTAGIPEISTEMVLKNPSILSQAPVPEEQLNQAVGKPIIDSIQQAKANIGKSIGKIYQKYAGMNGPMQEIIDTPIGQKINPITSDIPVAQKIKAIDTPKDLMMGGGSTRKFVPGDIVTEKKVTGFSPGAMTAFPDKASSYNDLLINKNLADQAFNKNDPEALSKLYKEYVGTSKSNTDLLNIGDKEKLEILTRMKRDAQAQASFNKAPITLQPIDSAKDAAFKKISADIDSIRGQIPGGDKLATADAAWKNVNDIYDTVQKDLSDPGKSKDTMMRLLRGDTSWLTSGKMKTKVDQIRRVEELTGKKILEPAMEELTRQVFNQNLGKGFSANLMRTASTALGGGAVGAGAAHDPLAAAGALVASGATMAASSPKLIGLGIRGAQNLHSGLSELSPIAQRAGTLYGGTQKVNDIIKTLAKKRAQQ